MAKSPFLALFGFLLLFATLSAGAEIIEKSVDYHDGEVKLKGWLYYDDQVQGKRPGILVVHEWWGLNDYAKHRAHMLAELGYVAFAADMYGDGKVTEHGKTAGEWMQQITANQAAWQHRAALGLDVLRTDSHVDPEKLAAIGYCFGGATVMQMTYAGMGVKGVVSFHGSLPPATEEQVPNIKASILVEHGEDDPFVPPERIAAFKAALEKANADWLMVAHGGTKHSFTNPGASAYGMDALQYNSRADHRSWSHMQQFLEEIFAD